MPTHLGRESLDAGQQRGRRARHTAWDTGDEVNVHLAAEGQPIGVDQASKRRNVPEVEQLELGDDLALLRLTVEPGHEGVRVEEDVVAKVGGSTRQAAGVGLGVQDCEPLLERIVVADGRAAFDASGGLDGADPDKDERERSDKFSQAGAKFVHPRCNQIARTVTTKMSI